MQTALFRPEVMQASQTQWLGSIRISRPPWFGWVTLIALTLALTLVAFSVWGQVTRKAKLRHAVHPNQRFGMAQGQLHAVSQSPIFVQDLPPGQAQALLMASQSQEPLYRITVKLHNQIVNTYGKSQALKAGMALEADVIQDRRAVWEWVMEPVLAAHKQVKFSMLTCEAGCTRGSFIGGVGSVIAERVFSAACKGKS